MTEDSDKKPAKKMNGSIPMVPEWLKVLFSNNPALMLVAIFLLWADGRIQSPEEKQHYLLPIEIRLQEVEKDLQGVESQLDTHQQLGGHLEMDLRMKNVERWIEKHQEEKDNIK